MSTTVTTAQPQTAPQHTFTFPFTDRASYLAWRAEWRESYALHSHHQRNLKANIARLQKDGECAGTEQSMLVSGREAARFMLEQRMASKIEAQRQWEASRAASLS